MVLVALNSVYSTKQLSNQIHIITQNSTAQLRCRPLHLEGNLLPLQSTPTSQPTNYQQACTMFFAIARNLRSPTLFTAAIRTLLLMGHVLTLHAPFNRPYDPTPKTGHVIFTRIGQTVHKLEYANLKITVNISSTEEQLHKLLTTLLDYQHRQNFQEGSKAWTEWQFQNWEIKRLLIRCEKLHQLKMLTPGGDPIREKRFFVELVLLTIFLTSLATTGYAIFKSTELEKMAAHLNTLTAAEITNLKSTILLGDSTEALAYLVKATNREASRHLSNMHTFRWHTEAISMARRRIEKDEATITALMTHRIAAATIRDVNLTDLGQQILKYTSKRNLVPIAKFFSDWLQVDASFLATPHGFDIYLHLPLMGKGSEMDIYRHINLPIPLSGEHHLAVDTSMEYFAVTGNARLFRGMSTAELLQCNRVGDFYTCPRGNVVSRPPKGDAIITEKDPQVCLWALFKQKYLLAKTVCDLSITTRRPQVIQLSASKFAVYSNLNHQGKIMCRNDTRARTTTFSAHHITMVHLDPGCLAYTDTHVFSSSDVAFSRPEDAWEIHFHWPYTGKALSNGLNMDKFQELANKADGIMKNYSRIPLQEALDKVQKMDDININDWLPHITTISLITALLALILAAYTCHKTRTLTPMHMYAQNANAPPQFPQVLPLMVMQNNGFDALGGNK